MVNQIFSKPCLSSKLENACKVMLNETFKIQIEVNCPLYQLPVVDKIPEYDPKYDDFVSVIHDICVALAETKVIFF